jgi:hypothetical protein
VISGGDRQTAEVEEAGNGTGEGGHKGVGLTAAATSESGTDGGGGRLCCPERRARRSAETGVGGVGGGGCCDGGSYIANFYIYIFSITILQNIWSLGNFAKLYMCRCGHGVKDLTSWPTASGAASSGPVVLPPQATTSSP